METLQSLHLAVVLEYTHIVLLSNCAIRLCYLALAPEHIASVIVSEGKNCVRKISVRKISVIFPNQREILMCSEQKEECSQS